MIWTIRFILYYETICRKLEVFSDNGSLLLHPVGGGNTHFCRIKKSDEEELKSSLAAGR